MLLDRKMSKYSLGNSRDKEEEHVYVNPSFRYSGVQQDSLPIQDDDVIVQTAESRNSANGGTNNVNGKDDESDEQRGQKRKKRAENLVGIGETVRIGVNRRLRHLANVRLRVAFQRAR